MRIAVGATIGGLCLLGTIALVFWLPGIAEWAVAQQRAFQNELALAVHAIRSGDIAAWIALLAAAGGYGFVHAVGPGHGKYLIAGVGLGHTVSARRLLSIAFASSICQALWAIVLVYGGLSILEISARHLTKIADTYLASFSYLAIGAVGAVLVWRGTVLLLRQRAKPAGHHTHSGSDCGCGAKHGPTPEEVARLTSLRETAALIISIAARPCTGAVFLLVIAWQLDILWAGIGAVITMGLGTALMTSLVAASSVAARGLAVLSIDGLGRATLVMPILQVFSGIMIMIFSFMLFRLVVL